MTCVQVSAMVKHSPEAYVEDQIQYCQTNVVCVCFI